MKSYRPLFLACTALFHVGLLGCAPHSQPSHPVLNPSPFAIRPKATLMPLVKPGLTAPAYLSDWNEEITEDAGAIQITWKVVLRKPLSKPQLAKLANELIERADSRVDDQETRSVIYDFQIYPDKAHLRSGRRQCVMTVNKNGLDLTPQIIFKALTEKHLG